MKTNTIYIMRANDVFVGLCQDASTGKTFATAVSQFAVEKNKLRSKAKIEDNVARRLNQAINKVADSIDQFSYIASLAGLFPQDFENILIDDMNFKNFFTEFNTVLSDFEQAFKNNDTVLIGDLSEYEICPRLKAISESLSKL